MSTEERPLKLEQSGLLIELHNGVREFCRYEACTHGGWAKYLPGNAGERGADGFFETKTGVIEDANRIAKYYNCVLEVSI